MNTDRWSITLLLDYYGGMLTPKQREYLELYYNEDLSLSEIAEITGITRPGVHNIIQRSRAKLIGFEKNTGVVEHFLSLRTQLEHVSEYAEQAGADTVLINMINEVANGI